MLSMSGRALDTESIDGCRRTRGVVTHTLQTTLTCSYCGASACSTKLAYSDESPHAFGHANRSERVHMVLGMPSSPDLRLSSSVVPPPHHRPLPSAASRSSIRHTSLTTAHRLSVHTHTSSHCYGGACPRWG